MNENIPIKIIQHDLEPTDYKSNVKHINNLNNMNKWFYLPIAGKVVNKLIFLCYKMNEHQDH